MSLTNGHIVSKETWESHNKMMLEPLATNDSEVWVDLLSGHVSEVPSHQYLIL